MRSLKHPLMIDGRGKRTPRTLLEIDERDAYLMEAAKFYPGCSDCEIAGRLRSALMTYHNERWRRDRIEGTCPAQHRGKLVQTLCCLLKVRDRAPSEMRAGPGILHRTLSGVSPDGGHDGPANQERV